MLHANPLAAGSSRRTKLEVDPRTRTAIIAIGGAFGIACLIALLRAATGIAPAMADPYHVAITIHLLAVLPALPLGAIVLLSRKGTPRHRLLGKAWLALMIVGAASASFIRVVNGGYLSPIHIFVPITLIGSWRVIAAARRGDIARHKAGATRLYLLALIIPGVLAFMPGRLMGLWLYG